jgi:hypothetical protein
MAWINPGICSSFVQTKSWLTPNLGMDSAPNPVEQTSRTTINNLGHILAASMEFYVLGVHRCSAATTTLATSWNRAGGLRSGKLGLTSPML